MGSDDADGRTGAVHDESDRAARGANDGGAFSGEGKFQGARDAMHSRLEEKGATVIEDLLAELFRAIHHRSEFGKLDHGRWRLGREC